MFAPGFFNYGEMIKEELVKLGAEVHLYDERPNPTSLEKILIRKARAILNRKIERYYDSIVALEAGFNADYIFFVNPEAVNDYCIKALKRSHSNAKTVLYMWDSAKNKHIKQYFTMFDALFSFDRKDCEQYGMSFRPLFFSPVFENGQGDAARDAKQDDHNDEFVYDVSFVGTVHSDRAKVIYEVSKECDKKGLTYFWYLYIPGKLMYFLRRITSRYLSKIPSEYIHLTPISKERFAEIASSTNCTLDINHPKQTGLTMRTIEMLGSRRKIITTNESIREYDFYNPSNQILIDRNRVILDPVKIMTSYVDIDKTLYYKYSLRGWLEEIFTSVCE